MAKRELRFMMTTPMRDRFLFFLILGIGLCLASCAKHSAESTAQTASPAVPTVIASIKEVRPELHLSGVIAPRDEVSISSALTEPVKSVNVKEGDIVHRGQVLAVLDTEDLQANLESARRSAAEAEAKVEQTRYGAESAIAQGSSDVQSARAALSQAQQTLSQHQADLSRSESLLKSGYISQQAVDQQRTQVGIDQQAVRSAEAAVQRAQTNERVNGSSEQGMQAANIHAAQAGAASAQAQVRQLEAQLSKATIIAPIDGVIANRNLSVGEYPSGRTLFVIQSNNGVYAILNAASSGVFRIRKGSEVKVKTGTGSQTYLGKVEAVLGQVNPGSTNFTVKVLLPSKRALQPGVVVSATVALPAARGVSIPTAAMLDDKHDSVMVVNNDTARLTTVRELATDGTTSIITGLSAGQRVIANGQLGITDGDRVSAQ
jgi:HlyD family secretion protein